MSTAPDRSARVFTRPGPSGRTATRRTSAPLLRTASACDVAPVAPRPHQHRAGSALRAFRPPTAPVVVALVCPGTTREGRSDMNPSTPRPSLRTYSAATAATAPTAPASPNLALQAPDARATAPTQ